MGLPAMEKIPIEEDSNGVLKIIGTRVPLDTIIHAFLKGATAEEIVQQYPTLDLPDVYYVFGYFLKNRQEMEHYLKKRRQKRLEVRTWNESRFDPHGIRERLMARRKQGKNSDPPGR